MVEYNASRGATIGVKICLHDPLFARDTLSENPIFHEKCILGNFFVRRLYGASIPNPDMPQIEEGELHM